MNSLYELLQSVHQIVGYVHHQIAAQNVMIAIEMMNSANVSIHYQIENRFLI